MGSPIALPEIYQAAFEDFVIPSYEVAPFTTIQNRAMVTRSLKAIAGVERIMCKGVNLLQNEFGPAGQQVWEIDSKDSRVRLVGNWFNNSGAQGSRPVNVTANDYFEVTFYGTGLNILLNLDPSQDFRVSINGGAEGANLISPSTSTILNARNYGANIIVAAASGLSAGLHTIRVRQANATGLPFYGFEILNQRTDLAVYAGTGISNGSSQGLSALSTSAFNAGVSGTRGARVVKHVQGGVVSQSVQEVDTASKFLTLADHSNEEVVRRINFREFGANRADDFSTLVSASSRAFTLDDGSTTLVGPVGGASTFYGPDGVAFAPSSFVTLTFIGTGLDIVGGLGGQTVSTMPVSVNGSSVGTLPLSATAIYGTTRICSGLPYGTHTVKIGPYTSGGIAVSDFIIYQPKKPAIPAGALEVADYNLMASFVANTVASTTTIATGVLRKSVLREVVYVGTWALGTDYTSLINGVDVVSASAGAYAEYTFFGTGLELRFATNIDRGTNGNLTVSIDGNVNLSSYTTSVYGNPTYNSTTGVLNQNFALNVGSGLSISGLPLGSHKFRLTSSSAATFAHIDTIDIITPIHINQPNLKIGSQSLKSVTKYSPEKSVVNTGPDLSKAKAWVIYDQVNSKIMASYNVSQCLAFAVGVTTVFFTKKFKTDNYTIVGSQGSGVAAPSLVFVYGVPATPAGALAHRCYIGNVISNTHVYTNSVISVAFYGELEDE